ncbi:TraB/VirB10 family protein [Comamonas sp.]|uniref:TraB/VirB10 family protein n=1 Tax=Comamonas sp. TaxID=34028 RepID=UPI0012CB7860|nr:TraB/VirB10 family protein [Comamonas sp.]MPS92984.1 hypothetical protein [Comamonas sp.]
MSFKENMQTQFADIKQKWHELDPFKRRIIMAMVFIGLLTFVILYLGEKRAKESEEKANAEITVADELQTDQLVQPKVGEVGIDDLRGMTQSELERQRQQQEALIQNQEQITNDYKTGNQAVGQSVSDLSRQLASVTDEVKQLKLGNQAGGANGVSLPPLQGIDPNMDQAYQNNNQNQSGVPDLGSAPMVNPNDPALNSLPDNSVAPRPIENSDPFQIIRSGKDASKFQSNGYRSSSNASAKKDVLSVQAKLLIEHGLPTGSMIQGVLINGMDATAGRGKGNAVPALVRVKKDAVLPNRYIQAVKECFIIVSGVGNLATERAEMRGETISCIFKDGAVVDGPLSAYVVGEDGKSGLRGRVVSKQGSVIARSIAAGFFGGLGKQLAPSQVPTLDISGSDETKYQVPNVGNASKIALANGMGSSLDRVANFYMDLAEQMVPVIEIDAGRQVTLILNNKFQAQEGNGK